MEKQKFFFQTYPWTHPWRPHQFPRVTETNDHQVGDLEQHAFLSQIWRPEARNQGVPRAMLSLKALGKNPSSLLTSSLIISAKAPFLNKSHSEVPGGHTFERTIFNPL